MHKSMNMPLVMKRKSINKKGPEITEIIVLGTKAYKQLLQIYFLCLKR